MIYTTSQFDVVDLICHRYYGRTQGTVEAVLAINPGLADLAPCLPQGLQILLPDLPKPTTSRSVRLWERFR